MAQLIIQNNGRQPFTFYVLRADNGSSAATIIEKIHLKEGNQFHFRVEDIAGKSFSVDVGTGGEKGDTVDQASFIAKLDINFNQHDRWTAIYNGSHWSVF
ncbi:MAG: hypothetical protein J0I41_10235 [Filimonas sp.]|nr:hypothetical protein [Filimonas sp.]